MQEKIYMVYISNDVVNIEKFPIIYKDVEYIYYRRPGNEGLSTILIDSPILFNKYRGNEDDILETMLYNTYKAKFYLLSDTTFDTAAFYRSFKKEYDKYILDRAKYLAERSNYRISKNNMK